MPSSAPRVLISIFLGGSSDVSLCSLEIFISFTIVPSAFYLFISNLILIWCIGPRSSCNHVSMIWSRKTIRTISSVNTGIHCRPDVHFISRLAGANLTNSGEIYSINCRIKQMMRQIDQLWTILIKEMISCLVFLFHYCLYSGCRLFYKTVSKSMRLVSFAN